MIKQDYYSVMNFLKIIAKRKVSYLYEQEGWEEIDVTKWPGILSLVLSLLFLK